MRAERRLDDSATARYNEGRTELRIRHAVLPQKAGSLGGMAARRLLDALGTARQAVISAQTQVKVAGPVYHGCQMVTAAIDALAQLITGSPRYFHARAA